MIACEQCYFVTQQYSLVSATVNSPKLRLIQYDERLNLVFFKQRLDSIMTTRHCCFCGNILQYLATAGDLECPVVIKVLEQNHCRDSGSKIVGVSILTVDVWSAFATKVELTELGSS